MGIPKSVPRDTEGARDAEHGARGGAEDYELINKHQPGAKAPKIVGAGGGTTKVVP